MEYFLAVLVSYYLVEAFRHLQHQMRRWTAADSSLPLQMRVILASIVLLTAIFWPVMFLFKRQLNVEQ